MTEQMWDWQKGSVSILHPQWELRPAGCVASPPPPSSLCHHVSTAGQCRLLWPRSNTALSSGGIGGPAFGWQTACATPTTSHRLLSVVRCTESRNTYSHREKHTQILTQLQRKSAEKGFSLLVSPDAVPSGSVYVCVFVFLWIYMYVHVDLTEQCLTEAWLSVIRSVDLCDLWLGSFLVSLVSILTAVVIHFTAERITGLTNVFKDIFGTLFYDRRAEE